MRSTNKRHIIASVGTVLFMLLLFLLLWFITLTAFKPEEEEGIEIAFGEVQEAGGYMAQQSEAVPMPAPQQTAPPASGAPSDNDLMTQEDEEALALRREQEKKERERKQAEKERLQREKEEQAHLEEEKRKQEKEEAERKQKNEEAIAKANKFGSLFGQSGNTNGSGDSQGPGQKGNPVEGHGSKGGNSWSLEGRDIKGTLPQPSNTFKQEGRVIVEIRVNAAGQVVRVTHKGGDVSDKQTIQLALDAARKAQFTEGDHDQVGTITYIFKLN